MGISPFRHSEQGGDKGKGAVTKSAMNRDEAERARDLAKVALARGEFERALKFSSKASKLCGAVQVELDPCRICSGKIRSW